MALASVFRKLYRQEAYETAEHFKEGLENANRFREVVFSTIEGIVILAALEVVAKKTTSIMLWILYYIAWLALFTYLMFFARYLINAINEKFERIKNERVFSYVAATTASLLSWGLVALLTRVTSEFIAVNFMQ